VQWRKLVRGTGETACERKSGRGDLQDGPLSHHKHWHGVQAALCVTPRRREGQAGQHMVCAGVAWEGYVRVPSLNEEGCASGWVLWRGVTSYYYYSYSDLLMQSQSLQADASMRPCMRPVAPSHLDVPVLSVLVACSPNVVLLMWCALQDQPHCCPPLTTQQRSTYPVATAQHSTAQHSTAQHSTARHTLLGYHQQHPPSDGSTCTAQQGTSQQPSAQQVCHTA
jgi:adenine-specific DNA-methyltransferase